MKDENGEVGDDVAASRIAAEHIGSPHHELLFSVNDYYEALPQVINKLETYDPSLVRCAVPCYFTCKLASEYVTVVSYRRRGGRNIYRVSVHEEFSHGQAERRGQTLYRNPA